MQRCESSLTVKRCKDGHWAPTDYVTVPLGEQRLWVVTTEMLHVLSIGVH